MNANGNDKRGKSYWYRGQQRFTKSYYKKRGAYRGNFRGNHHNQETPRTENAITSQPSTSFTEDGLFTHQRSVQSHLTDFNIPNCPYLGWKYYFHNTLYNEADTICEKLKIVERYLLDKKQTFNLDEIETKRSFITDIESLINDKVFTDVWPDFLNDLKKSPEEIINCFGLGMHHMLTNEARSKAPNFENGTGNAAQIPSIFNVPIIIARFVGFEPVTLLKYLKANAYGKFVSIRGTVVRVSNVKPLCTKMAFQCFGCHNTQVVLQPYGKYTLPTKCIEKGCRCHTFVPLRNSSLTETVDWQSIRLQESIADDKREGGRVPRTIECELMCDLVDICVPGDNVTVSGVVKVISSTDGHLKGSKDKCMFLLYIFANSITNLKDTATQNRNCISPGFLELSIKDLYAIQAIQAEENLFRLFTASLCPAIYGHEMVKAGLVLSMIGGTQKYFDDHNCIPIRGDPHILIVGDPGLGKSQMLQACSNIAPRGVYVCGNTTTTSGLTVTLCKEGSGGEYALEAGALVLADQGCCCIDEFDKMSSQHNALLEAMEQQTISIAKGGMVCSLPARTSVLAAANPVGGHYNKSKTVAENLKIGSALLSRFDLVFILLDKPDEELDSKLSEHVIALHSGKAELGKTPGRIPSEALCSKNNNKKWSSDSSLSERLTYLPGESCDLIPHQLLLKYIAYARKYVQPKLSKEAADVLQEFYLDLRKRHQTKDSTPITTRQLESLIRLTEARARLDLREICTVQDAKDVVEIMKASMIDTYSDEFGLLDFQRSQHGSGMSSRSQAKKFVVAMTKISDKISNSFFTVQQMKQIAKDIGIQVVKFEEFLTSLNLQGFLLKKGPKLYQLQTTDF